MPLTDLAAALMMTCNSLQARETLKNRNNLIALKILNPAVGFEAKLPKVAINEIDTTKISKRFIGSSRNDHLQKASNMSCVSISVKVPYCI